MKYKPSYRTIVCGIVRNPRNASRLHASVKALPPSHLPLTALPRVFHHHKFRGSFPVYTSYLAKDKYNEILSLHRYGRCARPWPFSRLRSGKSSPCDTQYDSLAQYCGNKDIWRISSCVYGILPYCKQSFREDERRNFASGVYILGGFDELLLPSLLYPFFPHANARCTRFRFFHSSAFSRESLRSLV